jgi:hypothetical protein
MQDTPIGSLERKVLTLCGQRGVNKDDPGYSWGSIERGYAGLNGRIHRLQLTNPGLVIHSVSHHCVIFPDPHSTTIVSATIVYSGNIVDRHAFHSAGDPARTEHANSDDLEDSRLGYGTVYSVNL